VKSERLQTVTKSYNVKKGEKERKRKTRRVDGRLSWAILKGDFDVKSAIERGTLDPHLGVEPA
jgi:hypothetical protein